MKVPPASLPAGGAGWNATTRSGDVRVHTVWDEEAHRPDSKRLEGLSERIGSAFEAERRSRAQQRQLVDELHEDQLLRLDEIATEIDASIAELVAYVDDFMRTSRATLEGTFAGLHSDLRARIEGLRPKVRQLEERRSAVRSGLEEERAARVRETAEILMPLREQIVRLDSDLRHEQQVHDARAAELRQRLNEAVASIDSAVDIEISSREQRVAATAREWQQEQEQLSRRQEKLERGLEEVQEELLKETDLEREQRIGAQDPIVEAVTDFIRKFQANAKEQSVLGN